MYSMQVPPRAIAAAMREGRRSSGYEAKSRFFSLFGKKGPLFIITMITDGKWWLTLEVAAQNQMAPHRTLHAEIHRASPLATVRQTRAA